MACDSDFSAFVEYGACAVTNSAEWRGSVAGAGDGVSVVVGECDAEVLGGVWDRVLALCHAE